MKSDKAPLLVDFEGGTMTYHHGGTPFRTEDGSDAPKPSSVQTSGWPARTPPPRCCSSQRTASWWRNSATDEEDDARKTREREYTERVDEASGNSPAAKPPTKPM